MSILDRSRQFYCRNKSYIITHEALALLFMQLTCCAHNQLFHSCVLLAAVCCAPARVSASTELLTRDWAPWPAPSSAHQTTATSEPRAELDVISLHTFPFILPRSVNLLSPPSTRPHQVHSLHILAALLTPSCPRPPPVPPPPAPGPRPIENVGELPEITFVRIILNFQ